MLNLYNMLSTIVKCKTTFKTSWEEQSAARVQLTDSLLKYFHTCGVELSPQQQQDILYNLVDIFYDFEKFLKEAKND